MKIAIIGAMEEEVTKLCNEMENKKAEVVANSEFTSGSLAGRDCVLLKSGIGKVNAAMTTTILIERYKPDVLINTGSAGGLNPSLNVGDIVISDKVCHHDVDATAFGYKYGQVPGMPESYKADERLTDIALNAAGELGEVQVVKGLIASGDSFISDSEQVKKISKHFPELEAVEMEGSAIAQIAYQYGLPFVIIRSLSDIAGKESGITFEKFIHTAATNSAKLVLSMIPHI